MRNPRTPRWPIRAPGISPLCPTRLEMAATQARTNLPFRIRKEMLEWDPCCYCGAIQSHEIDHYIPKSRGGGNTRANLVAACYLCNRDKADLFVDEWRDRRIRLNLPWPPLDSHEIWMELHHLVIKELAEATKTGCLRGQTWSQGSPEYKKAYDEWLRDDDGYWDICRRFRKVIYNGQDVWDEARAALVKCIEAMNQAPQLTEGATQQ